MEGALELLYFWCETVQGAQETAGISEAVMDADTDLQRIVLLSLEACVCVPFGECWLLTTLLSQQGASILLPKMSIRSRLAHSHALYKSLLQ